MGHILLEGGAEFGGRMADADRRAMLLAGGEDARISIIPAAATPDNNQENAGQNGVRWFRTLGAGHVEALPIEDASSANDPLLSEALRRSDLIFILGGFPGYLAETLKESLCWDAMRDAWRRGGVIAGSSAGAMVLCEYFFDPIEEKVASGLNLVRNATVIPHHDTSGNKWPRHFESTLPDLHLVGIDEETGIIDDAGNHAWRVYGRGMATLYQQGRREKFTSDQPFEF